MTRTYMNCRIIWKKRIPCAGGCGVTPRLWHFACGCLSVHLAHAFRSRQVRQVRTSLQIPSVERQTVVFPFSFEKSKPKKWILRFIINKNNPPTLSILCRLLLVRLDDYIVNLLDFYFYRFIEKLTAFLQLQEFSLRNQPVDSSTFTARLFLLSSNLGLEAFSPRLRFYVLILI